jgi:hypothetical protein
MLSSIRENRIRRDELYEITLQIPENEYFDAYEGISASAAEDILQNHLRYHQDDGKPEKVNIKHNKNGHVVNITAELHYLGNDHTKQESIPDMLNYTRNNVKQK